MKVVPIMIVVVMTIVFFVASGCTSSRVLAIRVVEEAEREDIPVEAATVRHFGHFTTTGLGLFLVGVYRVAHEDKHSRPHQFKKHELLWDDREYPLLTNRNGIVVIQGIEPGESLLIEAEGFAPAAILAEKTGFHRYSLIKDLNCTANQDASLIPVQRKQLVKYGNWIGAKLWVAYGQSVTLESDEEVILVRLTRLSSP